MHYRVAEKVNPNSAVSRTADAVVVPAAKDRRTDAFAARSAAADSIELSSFAESMAAATRETEAGQAARLHRLESLYAAGHYEVDAEKVSQAIVEEALTAGAGYTES